MHPIDTLYTNIYSYHTVDIGETKKPPKCKVKLIYDEVLSKFIMVGRHLQTLSDQASQYAAAYCFLKAYDILHSYCTQTTYIKNYDFLYDANFYECMYAGQMIMCTDFYNLQLFNKKESILISYNEGQYDTEVTKMLEFLYSEKASDSVNILAEMYVLWEFQFILNVRELTTKYTVSDYNGVAQELLSITLSSLEIKDCCTRLRFMIDNYVIQNKLSFKDCLDNDIQEFMNNLKRYKTCKAMRIVLCYDNHDNITGIYYYIDKFGKIHFNRVPITFTHPTDMFGTYTIKISEQYKLTFRVFDNSIHFYQHSMCSCYGECENCIGMLLFLELRTICSKIDVYVHDLAQELCTSLIDHKVDKVCTVTPDKNTILMCDNSHTYVNIPEEEANGLELWHKFNQ